MNSDKANTPKFFNHSVAARTTFIVLLVVSVIMITVGVLQMNYVRRIVAEESNRQASRSMLGAIKVIDNRLSNVETAVNTAASFAQMFAPFDELNHTLMQRLIEANTDISAVTLLYKADYFPQY